MSTSQLTRRNLLWGVAGVTIGGAVATGTGLSLWYFRRQQNAKKRRRRAPAKPTEGWMLTEADHQAIQASDAVVDSNALEILDEVDFVGGDYAEMGVTGLQDCVAACEADTECGSFTYARSTHPLSNKRQMCWLKTDIPETRVEDAWHYVSGIRKGS